MEENLRSLKLERMALVNLRLIGGGEAEVPLEEQLGTLEDLRGEGKLELIGLSNVTVETVHESLAQADIACVQNGYSILDRSHEDVLELCIEHDLAFVPFFPLGSAFTGGPAALAADPAVAAVAARREATPSQVALAWLLARDEHILLIPGTSSVVHLEENHAAADLVLDPEDLEALEQVRQLGDPHNAVRD